MKFQRHAPRSFLQRVEPILRGANEENHLLHSFARRLESGTMTLSGTPLLASVDDASGPVLAALRMPPGNLIVSTGLVEATPVLATGLRSVDVVALPGVTGPRATAEAFAQHWTPARELVNLSRARACSRAEPLPAAKGKLRHATDDDVELIASWVDDFGAAVFKGSGDSRRFVTRRVGDEAVFVWDVDGRAVSMSCVDGDTADGVRLDWIYTPPAQRGRGFAKSCVTAVTARMLAEEGHRFCLAHAVTADTRANAFLERVGFRAIGVQATWRFNA